LWQRTQGDVRGVFNRARRSAPASSPSSPFSYGLFWAIKKTVGLRVSERHEIDGLDINEHGMWGYPEQFMSVPGGAYIHPDAVAEPARQLIGSLMSTSERTPTAEGVTS
jgi:hypothetical protein